MRLLPALARSCLALTLAAPAAEAERLEPTPGYFIGCDAEAVPAICYFNAAGFNWAVSQANAPADLFDLLTSLPMLEPVTIAGDYAELADSSADLALTGLSLPDEEDINIGNLRAMQGEWQPNGEEAPFSILIVGMDWLEMVNGEMEGAFMIAVGPACADGVEPGGMAISLYLYGDDPAADACWQLEYIDDTTMNLRDVMGAQGQVAFTRLPPSEG